MWKKLLENKKLVILIIMVVFVFSAVLICVLSTHHLKKNGGLRGNVGTEENKTGIDDDDDENYNGEGLETEDVLDDSTNTITTIDGSGSWEEDSNNNGDETQSGQSGTTQSGNTKSETAENDEDDGELEKNVLEDDKVWTVPN